VIVARTSTLPKRLQPMLATLTESPFDDKEWIFEDKYDGFRMVATIEGGEVTLYSRNGKILSHNYIEITKALEGIKHDAVIDGELVAIGSDGLSHFQLLQNARRQRSLLIKTGPGLRWNEHIGGDGETIFLHACKLGLEGIVSKRKDSPYRSGRSADWLKMKNPNAPAVRREAEEEWGKDRWR